MTRKVEGGTAIKPLPFRGGVGVGPVGFAQGRRPPPAATRQQAAKFRCPPLKGRVYWRQSARFAANRRSNQSGPVRSEEHTSELQSLMRISYAVFCLKKK